MNLQRTELRPDLKRMGLEPFIHALISFENAVAHSAYVSGSSDTSDDEGSDAEARVDEAREKVIATLASVIKAVANTAV